MKVGENKILNGKQVAKSLEAEVRAKAEKLQEQDIVPGLSVILVGDDPASEVYVSYKEKACQRVGINSEVINLPADTSQEELLAKVEKLNQANEVDGILVQLPLPEQIDEEEVIETIDPAKDVDGFHPVNVGKLVASSTELIPCTPKGIMELLNRYNIDLVGQEAVVVGRSNIVGKPIANLLLQANATVTICHSRTQNLTKHTKEADILVAAVGQQEFITADMVKEGATVIDVGIHRTGDGLVGDVAFEEVQEKVAAITPVPGGVGPLTIASLMENTLVACQQRRG
ncbi:5,10-methylene-tetrahydrofolate dehydrogenase/methenyl tetrahydrofolate cyclohydrolase [Halobacteroides halobius DSM 5150]|uniref:Bifunctional protein FolD n=1 Tax=Halobacteroides halobius (strain ATCC 35273 / DSM 5150 / MD-1) TaxID=748449 RepID=L0K7K1_HALHC|nr:bifunctional methylenetetrahydrofolate dehydrogenase/methenyltetrahydrofolate cyclohydrolase FolD [Halobacteroides halobius]AGB40525.1 5,10-methylene-tetrahydrofolate dehydrogenase/methenyl tetrahydrofolate cyclohydrolase [Halobacteroides halobius DSM 5150]